jgi:APA family basic amino acid/polyamine antiporter
MTSVTPTEPAAGGPELARRLGVFDATMIVMGGIVGAGIFMNPHVVAREVPTAALALGAWGLGGLIALAGAFLYAELAARRPAVGGQYAYLREAFHPLLGFSYGWALLLVVQTGGMAAVALTFARYFRAMTGLSASDATIAVLTLAALTVVNCLGVRAGSTTQDAFMVLKIGALVALVACGLLLPVPAPAAGLTLYRPPPPHSPLELLGDFGAAMVPVLFAYGGWQTASFVAGEMRRPRRDLPRGLLLGTLGVVVLYLLVNVACLRVLGIDGLALTEAPASAVMQRVLGDLGGRLIAAGIAVSTVGFLSQGMLAAPRVYYAMAADGLFFRSVGRLHPRSRAPVAAIALQGVAAAVIALSGRYEQILGYVVPVDWIFITLTACSLFVLRRRDAAAGAPEPAFRMPGHPWSTGLLVLAGSLLVGNTLLRFPVNTAIGLGIVAAGVPAYLFWRRRAG